MAEQIGRYEIRREIGRGGMATVYLAYDPRIRRLVAIKVLPRQFTHDPKYLARFQQEAQMIATLEHPAIVPIYDFGEHDDAPYLVMRYMSGGTLAGRLRGDPLPLEEIAAMLDRLAPALDYAHEVGVIHRDLKPGNILFDHRGSPYLADFGIARLAEASQTMTMIGTPAYMSPEQVESQLKLDGRSDIYALGVMLYELLAGAPPYTAETPTGQMLMHITKPVPDILAIDRDLPPGTQAVIEKAMAKDREERYQTAAELAAAVHGLAAAGETPGVVAAVAAQPEPEAAVEETPATGPLTRMEPAADAALEDGAEKVLLYTSPEQAAKSEQKREPVATTAVSGAAPPLDAGGEKGGGLPGWIWWVGALALVAIAVFGIRAILGGAGTEEPSPTPVVGADVPLIGAELGDTWTRPLDNMTMVYVPEGSFPMGSEEQDDEKPVHEVSLDVFWIDRTEVTNAQFAEFVDVTGHETTAEEEGSGWIFTGEGWEDTAGADWQHPRGSGSNLNGLADHPVVLVSWYDAQAYCEWAGARLPTEAQWEYAARGPQGKKYPWGDGAPSCDLAQYRACDSGTIPADSLPDGASWTGALNMSGNVWEWVNDWYDSDYYANSPGDNPRGPSSGDFKVLRGGSWRYYEFILRGANRFDVFPVFRFDVFGFRCVVSPGS